MAGNLSTWSVRHPIGVVALTLAVMVLGAFALSRLGIDLLPRIIYPEVQVRVVDPGVPATVMEHEVTRLLEEQLAVTEGAIAIQSRTSEGRSAVDLSFRYGEDIDQALRDASARLDRARRFLPATEDPPIIFKRDPFQLPVSEYIVSSRLRDPVELRDWAEFGLSPALVNLPGVAATEIGGGLEREILIIADPLRLAALGLDPLALGARIREANQDIAAGRLRMPEGEIVGRTLGRFASVEAILDLPLLEGTAADPLALVRLGEVAQVLDSAAEERLRIRLDGDPGIKLSVQKQPLANTVAVVDAVEEELARLGERGRIPDDIVITQVDDQARYIRHALRNAATAAGSGAVLAMLVVYAFLGDLRRTLIIGAAIPIAVLVTFILMAAFGLTFNIMTLGGLALGIGMLVDGTIVMLENLYRHQRLGDAPTLAADRASREVTSAILAATSTNLAAVLPFLFIGGLIGLLFRELIFTISAAIVAAALVALTLVPALASRVEVRRETRVRARVDQAMTRLAAAYGWVLARLLRGRWLVLALFALALGAALPWWQQAPQTFLPSFDEGDVRIALTADDGIDLEQMDDLTRAIESIVADQPETRSIFTTVGGFVFGRSAFESANRASLQVRLVPVESRTVSTSAWIARVRTLINAQALPGVRVTLTTRGIRGIRVGRGDDDLSLRIQGPDLDRLARLADTLVEHLRASLPEVSNLQHSYQEVTQELSVRLDAERAASLGLSIQDIGPLLRLALDGQLVSELFDGDRAVDIRLRLPRELVASPGDLAAITLFTQTAPRRPIRLGDLTEIRFVPQPSVIVRDAQQRIVDITGSVADSRQLAATAARALEVAAGIPLPPGYSLYEAGSLEALKEGRDLGLILLGLALFLVLVVMAVQYESLRNPLIILLSVPFALIGVTLGLHWTDSPISMPVWLGVIMLAGIVVNNAIVMVEFIELRRRQGASLEAAIVEAGRLRLRPILMTTLTTVIGMLPLALAFGEGAEMLQPLAIVIVSGLSFSTLVSLFLVPTLYRLLGARDRPRDASLV